MPRNILIGLIVLLLIGLGAWFLFGFGQRGASLSQLITQKEGFGGRKPVNLAGLEKLTAFSGTCLTGYQVQPAGIDENGQHYAVTLALAANPRDETALGQILNTDACQKEQIVIFAAIYQKVPLAQTATNKEKDFFLTTYLTKGGRRIIPSV